MSVVITDDMLATVQLTLLVYLVLSSLQRSKALFR